MAAECPTTITAAVRVRPFLPRELENCNMNSVIQIPKPGIVRLMSKNLSDSSSRQFVFDHTFWSFDNRLQTAAYASQETVYRKIGSPLLQRALEGYNACLLAYGMTASGKTHSITGPPNDPGIIPRLTEELFQQITSRQSPEADYSIELSYYEIYNEKIRDLLSTENVGPLAVREHPITGPYVEGLSHIGVRSAADVLGWLRTGDRQRTVGGTEFNDQSSRSHCIFTLYITRRSLAKYPIGDVIETVYTSQINIVDLAGSERQTSSRPPDDRMNESCQINKSLFVLGKVISQLARNNSIAQPAELVPSTEPRPQRHRKIAPDTQTPGSVQAKRSGYVSYRDSVLTWLLRDSLGGNSMTTMLATVSPSVAHYDVTLATLRYAKKAQTIVNSAVINEDPQGRTIRHLMAEVARLRQASAIRPEPGSPQAFEVARLRELLALREKEVYELSRQLTERTIRPGRPYESPSLQPLCHQPEISAGKPSVHKSTSTAILAELLDVNTGVTPLKRSIEPTTIDSATSPIRLSPEKLSTDASTDPMESWTRIQDQFDKLSRDIAVLHSQLIAERADHDTTKQSLAKAQLKIQNYEILTSALLRQFCSHVKSHLGPPEDGRTIQSEDTFDCYPSSTNVVLHDAADALASSTSIE